MQEQLAEDQRYWVKRQQDVVDASVEKKNQIDSTIYDLQQRFIASPQLQNFNEFSQLKIKKNEFFFINMISEVAARRWVGEMLKKWKL